MLTVIQYYGFINVSAILVWYINIYKRFKPLTKSDEYLNLIFILNDDVSTAILRENEQIFL